MTQSFAAFLLGALALSACAQAPQTPANGRLFGEVWSASSCGARRTPEEMERLGCGSKPVQTAIVVTSADGTFTKEIQSDEKGRYEIVVPPGEYRLRIAAEGTRTRGNAHGSVAAGESKELWLHLGSQVK